MNRSKAFSAVLSALAMGIAPTREVLPSTWAAEHLVVPDGPRAGARWDPALTPYLVEIVDQLASTSPTNLVVVRKSAQTGFTQVGQVWLGYVVDIVPAKTIMVLPTISVAQDFNREKLSPSIEVSPRLRDKVRRQVSRSSEGSTALNKRFTGGSIVITGANSAADLRSKTVRFAFGDEIEEWPLDLDGQGDPLAMLEARQMAFLATGDWKRLLGSTPTLKGGRVDVLFEAGDQRYWHVPCPHCGEEQRLMFFPDSDGRGGLRFNKEWPHNAWYACRHCGVVIDHRHKGAMVKAGRWVTSIAGAGRHPSYHIDTLHSLLVGWDDIAAKFMESKDDPSKLKAFFNLWLGQPWEERGEAPEWQRLFSRREAYAAGTIPLGGVGLTGAADVQKDGVYFEIVAWGVGLTSWVIDAGFLVGETADEAAAIWMELGKVYERRYQDSFGNWRAIDAFAVDSGYLAPQVYHWTRKRPNACAVKGQPGWYHPVIGTPTKVDVNLKGRKLRRGAMLWPVGTWSLKAVLYANLRKEGRRDGAEQDPSGYCHFGEFLDEAYFRQITAEYLKDREVKGRMVREWVASGANHFHDCRIYNMAMAEHLGLSRLRPDEWAMLAAKRNALPADAPDLLALAQRPMPPPTVVVAEKESLPPSGVSPRASIARRLA